MSDLIGNVIYLTRFTHNSFHDIDSISYIDYLIYVNNLNAIIKEENEKNNESYRR